MNFGSNSTVRHESFSTASRVGLVAAIDGWMRAEYAILGTYRGGDRAGGSHGVVAICNGFLSAVYLPKINKSQICKFAI